MRWMVKIMVFIKFIKLKIKTIKLNCLYEHMKIYFVKDYALYI